MTQPQSPLQPPGFNISFGLEDTHVRGCGLIGRVVVDAFLAAGSLVSVVDLQREISKIPVSKLGKLRFYAADISSPESIDDAFAAAEAQHGPVECCLAIASIDLSSLQQCDSICDMDPAAWEEVMKVNVNGTFLTARRWLRGVRDAVADAERAAKLRNVGLVLMGSEAGRFGVRTMAAYAAGKAAVQYGMLQSLAMDAPRIYARARVNAVAPGAVDTKRFKEECERHGEEWRWGECEATVPLAKPVPAEDVARTFLFLASERFSGSTHGQLLEVTGGKTGSLAWMPGEKQREK